MAYYGYQYKQQCYIPGGVKQAVPVFAQCHNPTAVKCVSHSPCAPRGAKLCAVRKTVQSSPKCSSSQCSSGCAETHFVESQSSSCSPRSPGPCTMVFPQPHLQGREQLCMPPCGQPCPQICVPAHMHQHSSYPYSYQWSNSYHYNCGQQ